MSKLSSSKFARRLTSHATPCGDLNATAERSLARRSDGRRRRPDFNPSLPRAGSRVRPSYMTFAFLIILHPPPCRPFYLPVPPRFLLRHSSNPLSSPIDALRTSRMGGPFADDGRTDGRGRTQLPPSDILIAAAVKEATVFAFPVDESPFSFIRPTDTRRARHARRNSESRVLQWSFDR